MIPILILAAGASSRMRGRDKLLEDVDARPLLLRQIALARSVSDEVRVALPKRPHPRWDLVADLPVACIEVPDAAEGMGASLRRIFGSLGDDVDRAMLLLGDLPALTEDDLRKVIASVDDAPDALVWRGATQDGKGGHPMIVARPLFAAFQKLEGDDGGRRVVQAAGDRVHLVRLPGNRARLDLDTPEDWAEWRARTGD